VSALVLDCSVAVSWLFQDEADSGSDALQEVVAEKGAIVPALWPLEVANVLLQAERRGRVTAADTDERLHLLASLPVTIDDAAGNLASAGIVMLAREHGLTSYDAAYLELAARAGVPLATLDKALRKAAANAGVKVLP
jgi:predicted nucleic acid-binding protein